MSTREARKPKTSCQPCYQRKVWCDGKTPCGSCSHSRKALVCEYQTVSVQVDLPKGSACIPCRQRKRRCDGQTPCSTCKESSQADACKHREKPARREQESGPSRKRLAPRARTIMANYVPAMVIPAPLKYIDLDSDLAALRGLFLQYCFQYYGLDLTVAKREAIARGDASGALIHPIFIPISQLIGHLLADLSTSERWAPLRGQTRKEMTVRIHVLSLLHSSPDALDPLTSVQVYQILALYWAKRENTRRFQESLGTANNVILRHTGPLGLDDSAASDGVAQSSPEGRWALAQLVFTQVATSNFVPIPADVVVSPVILVKFYQLFSQDQNKLEINFVRAKGILLLAESQRLVTEWKQSESAGTAVGKQWSEQCRNLANDIQTHLHILNAAITKFAPTPNLHLLLLKSTTIVSLAALAAVHSVLAPFHAVAREKHRKIIKAIATVTRTLVPEDHDNFDCTLEVCWGIASQEISEQSPTPQWRRYLENIGAANRGKGRPELAPFEQVTEQGRPESAPFEEINDQWTPSLAFEPTMY